jgi:protein TonB
MPTFKSQTLSVILHVVVLGVLLILASRSVTVPREDGRLVLPLHLVFASQRSGGSNRTPLPARHGPPPPQARRTFIPPVSRPDPRLAMPLTVAFDSPTIQIDAAEIGDPSSRLIAGALGQNGRDGIGDVPGDKGIGSRAYGPPGISSNAGHKITRPELIYQVEPEFSEAARKAKYQGVVVLAIEVDGNGRPVNLRVLQGLGLGLDEKAIEAVSQWRFRPGTRDGRPFVTPATVEVNFRLL